MSTRLSPDRIDQAKNFFNQMTSSDSGGSVDISTTAKKDPIKADGDDVTGAIDFNLEAPDSRAPLNVVFCIDRSGSMSGDPLEVARDGLIQAAKKLGSSDYFSVVSFGSSASKEVPPTKGSNARSQFGAIGNIKIEGGTNIMKGLSKSKDMLKQIPQSEAAEWIVLISDGGSSINETKIKRKYGDVGITIHSAGILNYKQSVIQTVSEKTQGEWEDVGSPGNLGNFFERKIEEARGVVALDTELRLESSSETIINDIYYTHGDQQSLNDPEWDNKGCTIELGDLSARKPPKVRLDLFVDGEVELDPQTIVDVTLRTNNGSIHDSIDVEIAAPIIAEEKSGDGDNGRESLAVADIMETALEDGTSEAKKKIAEWESDDAVGDEALSEAETVVSEMEQSSDEKEARDNASRVLGNWDDE